VNKSADIYVAAWTEQTLMVALHAAHPDISVFGFARRIEEEWRAIQERGGGDHMAVIRETLKRAMEIADEPALVLAGQG
jgi:hypothetical protein